MITDINSLENILFDVYTNIKITHILRTCKKCILRRNFHAMSASGRISDKNLIASFAIPELNSRISWRFLRFVLERFAPASRTRGALFLRLRAISHRSISLEMTWGQYMRLHIGRPRHTAASSFIYGFFHQFFKISPQREFWYFIIKLKAEIKNFNK